jgi:hypothetical protein
LSRCRIAVAERVRLSESLAARQTRPEELRISAAAAPAENPTINALYNTILHADG